MILRGTVVAAAWGILVSLLLFMGTISMACEPVPHGANRPRLKIHAQMAGEASSSDGTATPSVTASSPSEKSPPAQTDSPDSRIAGQPAFSPARFGIKQIAVDPFFGDSVGVRFHGWYRHIDAATQKLDFSLNALFARTDYRGTTSPSFTQDLWRVDIGADYHRQWNLEAGILDLASLNVRNTVILVEAKDTPGHSEFGILDIPWLEVGSRLKSGALYDYISAHFKPVLRHFNFQNLSPISRENLRSYEDRYVWGLQNDLDGRTILGFWHVIRRNDDAWIVYVKLPFGIDLGGTTRLAGYGLVEGFSRYFADPRDQMKGTVAVSLVDRSTEKVRLSVEGSYKTDGDITGRILVPLVGNLYLAPAVMIEANTGYKKNIIGIVGLEYSPGR